MNDCLVTRLKGVVNDDTLPKLGECIVEVAAGYTEQTCYIGTSLADGGTVRIVGDGYFTLDEQQVKEVPMYTGNSSLKTLTTTGTVKLYIQPKYKITDIVGISYKVNADEFKWFCGSIQTLSANVVGKFDVSAINPLATVSSSSPKFEGSGLYGDATFIIENTNSSSTYGVQIRELFANNSMTADISKLSGICYQMYANNNANTFEWGTTRSSSSVIIAFPQGDFNFGDDLDAMLINQADCLVDKPGGSRGTVIDEPKNYIINVLGNRTSDSDAAVATLKEKGFAIVVNGETL